MNVITTSNAAEFAQTFARYRELSRKVPGEALAHRAGRMSMRLFEEFSKLRPNIGAMISAARARRFRVKRRGNDLTETQDGLSAAAVERARTMLGGRKSDWFRVTDGPDGVPQVRLARVGVRNANKLVRGGRYGNKFAASARGLSGLGAEQVNRLRVASPELRKLNLRALSVAFELLNRTRAGRGGLLALQFLHSVYQRRRSSTVKSGPLIARTRGGVGIGSVVFENDGVNGDVSAITIKGSVPGTTKVDEKHGVSDRAVALETADMKVYVRQKLEQAKKDAGLK
jgi:hypothetical protein